MTDRILLTGATGFLGRAVRTRLEALGYDITAWTHASGDLTTVRGVTAAFTLAQPTVVVHLACPYGGGGIGYADKHPFALAQQMCLMDSLLIEAAITFGTKRFYGMGSVCAYPECVELPTYESALWDGYPEKVNAPYGLAKRNQLMLLQAARQEYDLGGAHLILANLYGPGDKFGVGLVGHVIPASIVKIYRAARAGHPEIVAWGDGSPTRSFLYIDDAADAVVTAVQHYDDPAPINICSTEEIAIRDVITGIRTALSWGGDVRWDTTFPNGQSRRLFSNARARRDLGWAPRIDFQDGLARTIEWYLREQRDGSERAE